MVGIPGRSKGCNTCRKRKIRCDQQQPSCAQCSRSGRVCEGYSKSSIFLNRTARGLERRKPWEDIPSRSPTGKTNVPTRTASSNCSFDSYPGNNLMNATQQLPPQINNTRTILRWESLFAEKYLPGGPWSAPDTLCSWLSEALFLGDRGKALEYSLQALSMAGVSKHSRNDELAVQGRIMHGCALRELQKALYSKVSVVKDGTLAACKILAMYEVFESTSCSASGHDNHILGIVRILQYRSPTDALSPFSQALLENTYYSCMILALQYRKASLFDSFRKQSHSSSISTSFERRLYDKGFVLAALLEDIDKFAQSSCINDITKHFIEILHRCARLDEELGALTEELFGEPASALDWLAFQSLDVEQLSSQKQRPNHTQVPCSTLRLAHILVDAWALQLLLSTTIASLYKPQSQFNQRYREISKDILHQNSVFLNNTALNIGDMAEAGTRNAIGNMMTYHGKTHPRHSTATRLDLAVNIMRAMPFCTGADKGLSSAMKSLFALRVALSTLKNHPNDELRYCEQLFMDLASGRGLRFAQDLAEAPGGWSEAVRALERVEISK